MHKVTIRRVTTSTVEVIIPDGIVGDPATIAENLTLLRGKKCPRKSLDDERTPWKAIKVVELTPCPGDFCEPGVKSRSCYSGCVNGYIEKTCPRDEPPHPEDISDDEIPF